MLAACQHQGLPGIGLQIGHGRLHPGGQTVVDLDLAGIYASSELNAGGARVSFAEIVTDKGHDTFLLDEPELLAIVRGFLDGAARSRGLTFGKS